MPPKPNSRSPRAQEKSLPALQPARLDGSKFRQLYANLLRCRLLLEKLRVLEEQGSLVQAPLPQAGHEAVEAGVLIDLSPDDRVAPGLYSATARLLRGEPVISIIEEMLGATRASAGLKTNQPCPSTIPSCVSLAGQINLSSGAAWAFKTGGGAQVAVSFWEDGAIAADLWNEAVQFSILNKLPIVYVVHALARGSGAGGSLSNPGARPIQSLPVLVVDGDDAVAVYRVGQEAVRRARQGRGPCLIRCETTECPISLTRLSDWPQDSQAPTDPLGRLEIYLRQNSYWSEKWKVGLVSSFARDLKRAIERAEKSRLRVLRSARAGKSLLAVVG